MVEDAVESRRVDEAREHRKDSQGRDCQKNRNCSVENSMIGKIKFKKKKGLPFYPGKVSITTNSKCFRNLKTNSNLSFPLII